MSGLHVVSAGQHAPGRRPVVLVHGWAMNGAVWDAFGEALATERAVHRVDLPGHGRSPWEGRCELGEWAAAVGAAVPTGAVWIAWSLGAAVALRAALDGCGEPAGLVPVCGTPRFVTAADWPNAMDPAALAQFGANLAADAGRTVERFLGLQVRGAQDATGTLRRLRQALREVPPADPAALAAGLALLQEADLRPRLGRLRPPSLWLLGERDTLVPAAMGWQLAEWLPGARVEIVAGAGHAPFLSHPAELLARVRSFLAACDD
ncbi:MAG: pimeloyl-ACP methyl ester esterase BioH [Gammaproteobacteria bacterium]